MLLTFFLASLCTLSYFLTAIATSLGCFFYRSPISHLQLVFCHHTFIKLQFSRGNFTLFIQPSALNYKLRRSHFISTWWCLWLTFLIYIHTANNFLKFMETPFNARGVRVCYTCAFLLQFLFYPAKVLWSHINLEKPVEIKSHKILSLFYRWITWSCSCFINNYCQKFY